jgi:hypothetical protein
MGQGGYLISATDTLPNAALVWRGYTFGYVGCHVQVLHTVRLADPCRTDRR